MSNSQNGLVNDETFRRMRDEQSLPVLYLGHFGQQTT
jgi:hypothetical protein